VSRDLKLDHPLPLGKGLAFMRTLWQLNHAIERISRAMERSLGITAQQRMIVRCVGKFPGMTSGQLAAQLHLDAGTISTALGRLERKGLLDRRRDPKDRRRVALGLTAAGRAIDHPATGTIEAAVDNLIESSQPADLSIARTIVESLTRLIEAESVRLTDPKRRRPPAD
jgi:DNA-binding MarR family transcriptional regulator